MSEEFEAKQSAAARREIRVFISSTFRDMQEEREELVKQIFPQLLRLCESRGVNWGEVDLRWGLPDEAKVEGKVVPSAFRRSRTVGFTNGQFRERIRELVWELLKRENR